MQDLPNNNVNYTQLRKQVLELQWNAKNAKTV